MPSHPRHTAEHHRSRTGRAASLIALLALAIPWTGFALAADDVETQILLPPLTISEVFVDLDAEQIHVIGSAFGSSPSAHLGDLELQVLASTDNVLTAALPSLPPGSYRLKVSRGNLLPKQTDIFEVTLGAVGPEGPQGPQGPQGEEGPPGSLSGWQPSLVGELVTLPPGGVQSASVDCPPGKGVTGGGMSLETMDGEPVLVSSKSQWFPSEDPPRSGWTVFVRNLSGTEDAQFRASAVCVDIDLDELGS